MVAILSVHEIPQLAIVLAVSPSNPPCPLRILLRASQSCRSQFNHIYLMYFSFPKSFFPPC